ncbi:MAG: tRNA preQ1(34) S-adenosylmethionine ribosyltransferase-isomerase QueA [Bacteroidales bacterium]|jgi:S-adenosylmethionine:tRNA ribosyltransferase-isomerase|nr:tRNA preQ1(34) S-adenosylmethionine ribosyltransferase-isomerase QueA [Bacteroidales bacterium]
MKLSQFRFNLPKELIAEKPTRNRDDARLLVLHREDGTIEHRVFKDFIEYVDKDDVVVANNTKVFPALLDGEKEKTGAKIQVLLLRELNEDMRLWDVIVDPARKIRIGNKLYFGTNDALVAEVVDNTTSRGRTIRFLFDGSHEEFISIVKGMGRTPLPEELRRLRDVEKSDAENYQTIYAKVEGSTAAPIAGLHFSRELLKRMEIKDVKWLELTLHAGMGEFKPIEVEDLSKHRADAEEIHLSEELCNAIGKAKETGHHVCCIGTTTMRALESAVTIPGKIFPYDGWTNKFIFPPYDFTIADMMVTNFHHPMSSQFIMVSAFAGPELLMQTYQTAIKEKYRFATYGDAMLII